MFQWPDIESRSQGPAQHFITCITEKWKELGTFFTYVMSGSKDGKKDGRTNLTVHDRT